jgi:hypothetical protein
MNTNDSMPTDRTVLWSGLGFAGVVGLIAILSLLGLI